MLTLLKYDLKNTRFKMLLYCIAPLVVTVAATFCWSDFFEGFFDGNNFYWITICKWGSIGIWFIVCAICFILAFVALAQWFAQSLLAEEGHFMNMLPVSKTMLLLSKVLTALIWNFVLVCFSVICVMVFLYFGGKLAQINDILLDLMGDSEDGLHISQLFLLGGMFLSVHCGAVSVLSYVSIFLGHRVNIGKNAVTLLSFFGIGLAEIIVSLVLAYILGMFNFGDLGSITGIIKFFDMACIKMTIVSLIFLLINFAMGVGIYKLGVDVD